jgi:hypothetical protein
MQVFTGDHNMANQLDDGVKPDANNHGLGKSSRDSMETFNVLIGFSLCCKDEDLNSSLDW